MGKLDLWRSEEMQLMQVRPRPQPAWLPCWCRRCYHVCLRCSTRPQLQPPCAWSRLSHPAFSQLMLPADAAHDTVAALGEVGLLQFKDLNPDKSPFQRTFANQVLFQLKPPPSRSHSAQP